MRKGSDPYGSDPLPRNLVVWGLPAFLLAALLMLYIRDPDTQGMMPCLFYQFTGVYCTGCGTTRALHALVHGRIGEALSYNLLIMIWMWLPAYAVFAYWLKRLMNRQVLPVIKDWRWLMIILLTTAVLFLVLRNIPVYPFNWLAP